MGHLARKPTSFLVSGYVRMRRWTNDNDDDDNEHVY